MDAKQFIQKHGKILEEALRELKVWYNEDEEPEPLIKDKEKLREIDDATNDLTFALKSCGEEKI